MIIRLGRAAGLSFGHRRPASSFAAVQRLFLPSAQVQQQPFQHLSPLPPWLAVNACARVAPLSTAAASGGSGGGGTGGGDSGGASSSGGGILGFFDRDRSVAPPGYNRFLAVPPGILVTLSIGSVYSWSTFNGPLTRELGVLSPSSADWTLSEVVPIFSVCALCLGVGTTVLGPWAERAGPRKVAAVAAVLWSSGLALSAVGCDTHSLPLLYLGYGVLGGLGWGLGYISPVSNLMKWFPDRRGLATGMALASFGGGAMIAAPLNTYLCDYFSSPPTYLGTEQTVGLVTEGGCRFVERAGELQEVIVASASDLASVPGALHEGVYLVGTGDSGVAGAFATLGAIHFVAMMAGALMQRVPAEGWAPAGWDPAKVDEAKSAASSATVGNVHHDTVFRTPQFWLLWGAVFGNAVAGITIISCAKTMMGEVFATALPAVVTGGFATGYVMALSAANGGGRFTWAALSDYTGRKNALYIFGLGIPATLAIPSITAMVGSSASSPMMPLALFYGGTFLIVSFYGGIFSVLPAYIADTFGIKHAGAIHGRLLTAWSASALVGPSILTTLRWSSYKEAAQDLAASCDAERFQEKFGAGKDQLEQLMDAKTVTVARLMEIAPPGTLDPTPGIYDSTLYAMAGIMGGALLCNALIHPVNPKFFVENATQKGTVAASGGAAAKAA